MLLGDLLARCRDEVYVSEMLLDMGHLPLIAAMKKAAAAEDMPLGAYAVEALGRYSALADDEEWLTMIGQIGRADDPARAFLLRAFAAVACRDGAATEPQPLQ